MLRVLSTVSLINHHDLLCRLLGIGQAASVHSVKGVVSARGALTGRNGGRVRLISTITVNSTAWYRGWKTRLLISTGYYIGIRCCGII